MVTGEDLSEIVEVDKGFGKEKLTRAQLMMAWYVGQAFDIPVLVEPDGFIVGFGVARTFFKSVMEVRHVYLYPEYRGQGYMEALYLAATKGQPIRRVYFQTVKDHPPKELFGHTSGRRLRLCQDGNLITWETRWQT